MMTQVSDREAIITLFEETYAHNVRTVDADGYGEMYTEDALWMAPGEPDRRGIPDILEGFNAMVCDKDIDPTFTAEEVNVFGDVGYVLGVSIATIYPKDGSEPRPVKFRALWLMKKEAGTWKIDRQIWNTQPL